MDNDTRESDRRKNPRDRSQVSVDELLAKSETVFDRVVPFLERAASRIRSKLARK
jgi:hypothetical protein